MASFWDVSLSASTPAALAVARIAASVVMPDAT